MKVKFRKLNHLQLGVDNIISSPKEKGIVHMIVSRPEVGVRKILEVAKLDKNLGLIGDNWYERGSSSTLDKSADIELQLTIMNSRVITLMTQNRHHWSLAGDQLYIEMDISRKNLPPGSQLKIGNALVEVSEKPHTGCKKFSERFGVDALKFVSSLQGRELSFRGINTRIRESGIVHAGDSVVKVNR